MIVNHVSAQVISIDVVHNVFQNDGVRLPILLLQLVCLNGLMMSSDIRAKELTAAILWNYSLKHNQEHPWNRKHF